MKTSLTIILLAFTLLHAPTTNAGTNTYPPENAALLYYRAMFLYKSDDYIPIDPDNDISVVIYQIAQGEIPVDERAIRHLEENKHIINDLITASKMEMCSWAIDLSQNDDMFMLHLGEFIRLSRLIILDARVFASKGDYKMALQRCKVIEKMAEHVSGHTLIDGLADGAISLANDKCLAYIVGEMPIDRKELLNLKMRLKKIDRIERVKNGFEGEKVLAKLFLDVNSSIRITPELLREYYFKDVDEETLESSVWKEFNEKIAASDKGLFKSLLDLQLAQIGQQKDAFDLPYTQAYNKLFKKKPEKLNTVNKKKPQAVLESVSNQSFGLVYDRAIRSQNSLNALKTAVEIYLVKAKTGKLPDKIPADSPKDLFSGKDFIYEKTETGFILRCRARDLSKDTIHEYEFKVAK